MSKIILHGRIGVWVAAAVMFGITALGVWLMIDRHKPAHNAIIESAELAEPFRAVRTAGVVQSMSGDRPLTPLWQVVHEAIVDRKPAYDDNWAKTGRVLVDVSGAVAVAPTWKVGDRLAIPLPQIGEHYELAVDRINEGVGHSRSVRGTILGPDKKRRRAVVTVGPTRVFAYIDTPHGSYELVADTRLGWLLPSSSMMAGLDPSVPDYILPERRD